MIEKLQHKYALSREGAKDLVKAVVSVAISNIVMMLPSMMLYLLIGDLLNGSLASGHGVIYIVGSIVILVLIAVTQYIQYNATFFTTYKESGVRRTAIAERLRRLPLSFFGKRDLSDLTTNIMGDCAIMETASSHWIPELYGALISTTIVGISLFLFDLRMALASFWVIPVSLIIVGTSSSVQKNVARKSTAFKLDMQDGIQECLETAKDLKSNNAVERFLERLNKKIKAVEKYSLVSELTVAAYVSSAQMILKVGIGTTALVGGILLVNGDINVLTFFMFLMLVSRLYDPMQISLQNFAAIISVEINSERLDEVLSHPIQQGAETLTNKGYDIVFDNVKFSYQDGQNVLNNVSFTAKQGEVTALIGPSGGGKTTVSRLATRFWDIDSGKITVGGMDISKADPETLMSLYSIVFQDVMLFNNTVMENIRIGRKDATDEEVIQAAKMANCEEFVEKLPDKWNSDIGENGSSLSGGERQRISIARAFLKDAPIILLDEATASLDVENETAIQAALSALIKDKTVLIIAHRMRTVANADKIVVLKDGYIAEQGSPEKLKRQNGIYRHMSDLQSHSAGWKM